MSKEEIVEDIYKSYGTDSGILFGIKEKDITVAIVEFTLNRIQQSPCECQQLREALKKYSNHLPTCYINQDWTPAYQAMADTPNEYRDESYHIALEEMNEKRSQCTCGLAAAIASASDAGNKEETKK